MTSCATPGRRHNLMGFIRQAPLRHGLRQVGVVTSGAHIKIAIAASFNLARSDPFRSFVSQ